MLITNEVMVAIAQLVEPWIVIPVVVGSNPISHPIKSLRRDIRRRVAQLGSATGLGPVGRRFKSYLADHFYLFFNNLSDNLCGHLLIDLVKNILILKS